MAFMADLVIDIIFARDIGGFMSIMENNCRKEDRTARHKEEARQRLEVLI